MCSGILADIAGRASFLYYVAVTLKNMEGNLLFLQNLGIALLLGGLIGLEREKDGKTCDYHEFGIRTMALTAGLGYIAYSLFGTDTVFFSVITGALILLVLASYIISAKVNKTTGVTTEIAAVFVYLLGVLMAMGETLYAAVVALVVLTLLYFKEALHAFAHRVEKKELYGTLKFIAVVFVVLPLLPDQTFGPLDVLNPHVIWLMIILVASISFASYVAIKLLGPKKGIGVGGFLGGLISSTAVSMSFSQISKKSKSFVNPLVFGVMIASSAMFFRVLLEVAVLNQDLMAYLSIPLVSMGCMGLLISLFYWLRKGKGRDKQFSDKDLHLKSPFQLWPAIQFGLFFAALLFISKFASMYFGDEGLYLTALISGLADVDAITVSMANLTATQDVTLMAGATAVTIAAMTNTLVKGGIVLLFGSRAVGVRTLVAMILIVLTGVVSLLVFLPEYYGIAAV